MSKARELERMLERFVGAEDRSMEIAGRIEVMLEELYDDLEPYSSLALALASYRPNGGEYLYDAEQIARMMVPVLGHLRIPADGETS
jgi:hypothetical protein